ncbi:MAG TPA: type II toxin-antitoxin system PemK/MazF family toxin [Verrucomicrobiae bacterium]|nr:type II toxin-antitoxin system PemK/MazF family toxin [Verrucomicrobiae bacterium]
MGEFRPGDIILVEIPFTDLSATKKRPACVLSTDGADHLVAFITSRLGQARTGDVLVRKSAGNGLAVDSVVLVRKLFTVHSSLIVRKLGKCSHAERRAVVEAVIAKLQEAI